MTILIVYVKIYIYFKIVNLRANDSFYVPKTIANTYINSIRKKKKKKMFIDNKQIYLFTYKRNKDAKFKIIYIV